MIVKDVQWPAGNTKSEPWFVEYPLVAMVTGWFLASGEFVINWPPDNSIILEYCGVFDSDKEPPADSKFYYYRPTNHNGAFLIPAGMYRLGWINACHDKYAGAAIFPSGWYRWRCADAPTEDLVIRTIMIKYKG